MATNLELGGAVKRTQKGDTDWYYGGDNEAWPNLTTAKAGVPAEIRPGKTVGVYISGSIVEYWWPTAAITDDDLVIKTASSSTEHYKGKYATLAALQTALPIGANGDYAIVTATPNDEEYIWDGDHGSWVLTQNTPASTFALLGGNPGDNTALNAVLTSFQPLEDQRLSTLNSPKFTALQVEGPVEFNGVLDVEDTISAHGGINALTGINLPNAKPLAYTNSTNDATLQITNTNGTGNKVIKFPWKDGVVALMSDLTSPGVVAQSDAIAQTDSFTALSYVVPAGDDTVFRAEFSANITTVGANNSSVSIAFTDIYNTPQTIIAQGWPIRGGQTANEIILNSLTYMYAYPLIFKAKAGTTITITTTFSGTTDGVMDLYSTLIKVR